MGGKVAPKRPTLAPLEPTASASELTPRQVELLAKVEERYGKASADGVKKAIEKQASPKMTAYREKLLAADEAKHAKGLGMSSTEQCWRNVPLSFNQGPHKHNAKNYRPDFNRCDDD